MSKIYENRIPATQICTPKPTPAKVHSKSAHPQDHYAPTQQQLAELPKDFGRQLAKFCSPRDPQPRLGPNDHPTVFFTLADGRVIKAATAEQVKEISRRVGDGEIVKMVAQGHGCNSKQSLGVWDKSFRQGFTLSQDGHISLRNSQDQEIGDFGKLFGKKFRSQHSLIVFQGCYTAQDNQKNLAKGTSEALPGVHVIGNVNEGWGYAHILKTSQNASLPPLASGGYSTEAHEYYTDPTRPNQHARMVNCYEDDIIR